MLYRSLIGLALALTLRAPVDAQELWRYDCTCVPDWGSRERTAPDSVFALANAGYIAFCGWKEIREGVTIFTEFSLTNCVKGHPLSGSIFFFGSAAKDYTLTVEADTVIIQHLLPWPDSSSAKMIVTAVYEERYLFILEQETGEYPIIVTFSIIEDIPSASLKEAEAIYDRCSGKIIEQQFLTETDIINLAYAASGGHLRCIELFNELEHSVFLSGAAKETWNIYATVARMSY